LTTVLRRIFGPKRDEVTGGWRLHSLHYSSNIIRMITSRRMDEMGRACNTIVGEECIENIGGGIQKERYH
jgi:hypothetical protein